MRIIFVCVCVFALKHLLLNPDLKFAFLCVWLAKRTLTSQSLKKRKHQRRTVVEQFARNCEDACIIFHN